MAKPDLILIHPPSIYNFRERSIMYGPINDVIPSSPIFEMYPIGFLSIVNYLKKHGYSIRIINLALNMLKDQSFNAERLLRKLEPMAFGIDLHWLVHAHGSIEVARILKKLHPNTPLIFGGLSSTYYHLEIMDEFREVDYVIRGDSVEEPLLELLKCLENGKSPEGVSNLTWRGDDGRKHINTLNYLPEDLDDFVLDYTDVVDLVFEHRDLTGNLPFKDWMSSPLTAIVTSKGCSYDCVTCGGSCSAYNNFYSRERMAFKSPEKIVEEIKSVDGFLDAPVYLVNDIRQGGKRYVDKILKNLKIERIDSTVVFELFTAAARDFIKAIANSCPAFALEISPESHDEEIRRLQGRPYTNKGLEKTIATAIDFNCARLDVFFMIGLPGQTYQSVMETIEYCNKILKRYRGDGVIHPFIAPLAPFLDPGSLAFEDPNRYGFHVLIKSLIEHRRALTYPSWKHFLNYETIWMTRDEIVDATYDSLSLLNEIKWNLGLIDPSKAEKIMTDIILSKELIHSIDEIHFSTDEGSEKREKHRRLKEKLREIQLDSYQMDELRIPSKIRWKAILHLLRYLRNLR